MGDHFSCIQPTSLPTLYAKLIGKLIDIFIYYNLDGVGLELFWFQWGVTSVLHSSNILKPGACISLWKMVSSQNHLKKTLYEQLIGKQIVIWIYYKLY